MKECMYCIMVDNKHEKYCKINIKQQEEKNKKRENVEHIFKKAKVDTDNKKMQDFFKGMGL